MEGAPEALNSCCPSEGETIMLPPPKSNANKELYELLRQRQASQVQKATRIPCRWSIKAKRSKQLPVALALEK